MGLGCLVQSWCVPGVLGTRLGCVLERQGCVLEGSWGHLGASWGDFGGVWASLGSFLGAFWEYFWKFLSHLEQYAKIAKNLTPTCGFSLMFEVLKGFWSSKTKKNQ